MIRLNRKNDITVAYFTDFPNAFIKMINDLGYECEYTTNGDVGTMYYPNYKEIDEHISLFCGCETMVEISEDWEYNPPL